MSDEERNKLILNEINEELKTNLEYPDHFHGLIRHEPEEMLNISLNKDWIDMNDVNRIDNFMEDLQKSNFEVALANLEESTTNQNLNDKEFEKVNSFVNNLRSVNFTNPEYFIDISYSQRGSGFWRCARASLVLAASTAGLSSCVTVAACALAMVLFYNAIESFTEHCAQQ